VTSQLLKLRERLGLDDRRLSARAAHEGTRTEDCVGRDGGHEGRGLSRACAPLSPQPHPQVLTRGSYGCPLNRD
jgi:hypothetical protein